MNLPIVPKQKFEYESPFINEVIEYTPFTVGQESILIPFASSKDLDSPDEQKKLFNAICQIINECITNDIKIKTDLPYFIVEHLLLHIRSRSVSELFEFTYECESIVDDERCGKTNNLTLDILKEFTIVKDDKFTNTFELYSDPENTIHVKFKYPTIQNIIEHGDNINNIMIDCIEVITQGESVFDATQHDFENRKEFWNSIPIVKRDIIYKDFFLRLPKAMATLHSNCSKCGNSKTFDIDGIKSVFI